MGVYLVTVGCLEEAIARYLLTLSGANLVKRQIVRGWEEAPQYGLRISYEIRHRCLYSLMLTLTLMKNWRGKMLFGGKRDNATPLEQA